MIIGISGNGPGAGKDTVGQIIEYLTAFEGGFPPLTEDEFKFWLKKPHGKFKIRKFAEKLKENAALMLGVHVSKFEDQVFKETPLPEEWWVYELFDYPHEYYIPYLSDDGLYSELSLIKTTPRDLLQKIGTDLFRDQLNPDIWVNMLTSEYTEDKNWVITDVRFKNEIKAITRRGGINIHVIREKAKSSTHQSENDLLLVDHDYIISNDSDITSLIVEVAKILEKYVHSRR